MTARPAIFAAIAIVALAVPFAAQAFETKPYDAAAFKEAQDGGKPILVDVFAPWCPTCRAQQQVLQKLKDKPEYDKLTVFKVDYDNQKDAVKGFGARMQSTLIAFKGGKETGRSAGDTRADSIEALIATSLQ
jgi:thiol-disulfide isomerase/thioredoxin